jgi:hypothetical protein
VKTYLKKKKKKKSHKRAGGVAQGEALSSSPSTAKNKKIHTNP